MCDQGNLPIVKALAGVAETPTDPKGASKPGTTWITSASWKNTSGHPIASFSTTWQVPPAPATVSGQTIYLFNGIEPIDGTYSILQAVLQWNPPGGSNCWSVASWYMDGGNNPRISKSVPVTTGQTLVGLITLTGQSGNGFTYTCEFQGIAETILQITSDVELGWCYEVLEASTNLQCSGYPATDFTAMQSINIQTGGGAPTLKWTVENDVTNCGQSTKVISNSATKGEVDIYYRAPQA